MQLIQILIAFSLLVWAGREERNPSSCPDELRTVLSSPYLMPTILRLGKWYYRNYDVFWEANIRERVIALTFDDGPSTDAYRMPALLDVLAQERVKATFFVLGSRIVTAEERAVVARAFREGHQIGIHGYTHESVTRMSEDRIRFDYRRTIEQIEEAVGTKLSADSWFVRTPWGNLSRRAASVFREMQMVVTQASIVPGEMVLRRSDPERTLFSLRSVYEEPPDKVVPRILKELRPGAIVALHAGQGSDHQKDHVCENADAAETTRRLIPELRKRGYRLATVEELYRLSKLEL